MIDASTFNQLVIAWIGLGLLTFIVLLFITAPYGRHTRPGWGPTIGNRTGWLLMEAPAALVFAAMFLNGPRPYTTTSIVGRQQGWFHIEYEGRRGWIKDDTWTVDSKTSECP